MYVRGELPLDLRLAWPPQGKYVETQVTVQGFISQVREESPQRGSCTPKAEECAKDVDRLFTGGCSRV